MNILPIVQKIGLKIELSAEEARAINAWFSNRNGIGESTNNDAFRSGFQLMTDISTACRKIQE